MARRVTATSSWRRLTQKVTSMPSFGASTGIIAASADSGTESRSKLGDQEGLEDLRDALRTGRDRGLGEETSIAYNNYAYELWFHRGSWASIEAWEEMETFCRERGLATSLAWARSGMVEPLFDVGAWDRVLSISAELS